MNIDKHYMPGSHWVALWFSDSGYAEYFDSYGLPPYKREIMSYLQNHSTSWTFNHHRLQGLTSNVCGHSCSLYALHRVGGLSMTSFANMFTTAHYRCIWYKSCAGVPYSVWGVPRLQPLGASAAVVQVSSINKGTYTNYCQSKISQWLILPTWKERMVNWWSKSWQLSTFIAAGSLRMCLKDPKVGKICHCLTLD